MVLTSSLFFLTPLKNSSTPTVFELLYTGPQSLIDAPGKKFTLGQIGNIILEATFEKTRTQPFRQTANERAREKREKMRGTRASRLGRETEREREGGRPVYCTRVRLAPRKEKKRPVGWAGIRERTAATLRVSRIELHGKKYVQPKCNE